MGPMSQTWSLTNRLTSQVSPCAGFTTDLEEQPQHYDAMAVHPRAGRHPLAPPDALGPPSTQPLPTNTPYASLHYKQRVWSSVEGRPIHFQAFEASLRFLAQHQLQSSSLVVEQSKSRSCSQSSKSLLGLVQLLCNSFISTFTLFSFYLSTLFQYYCFALL